MPIYKGYLPIYFKGYGIFGTPLYKPHFGISGILWLYSAQCLLVREKTVGASRLERKISTSTSPLETEIIFNLLSLTVDPGVVRSLLTWSHTFVEFDHEITSQ